MRYFFCLIFTLQTALFSWTDAVQLSDSTLNFHPAVTMSSNGNAAAVWTRGSFPNQEIQASFYDGISWSAFETISESGANHDSAQVAIDGSGNVVAIWETLSGNTSSISSATRPSAGPWNTSVTISASSSNAFPSLSMNNSGSAIAGWLDTFTNIVQTASLTFGGLWSAPINLGSSGFLNNPLVGIDNTGNAIVVWESIETAEVIAIRRVASIWGVPQAIVTDVSTGNISLGVGSSGNAILAWTNLSSAQLHAITFNGTIWDTNPVLISSQSSSDFETVSFSSDGFITFHNLETGNIQAANYTGGSWQPSVNLSMNQDNDISSISLDNMGNAFIVWSDFFSGQVIAVLFPTGMPPDPAETISGIGSNITAQVSAAANERAVAAWVTTTNGNQVIQGNVN